MTIDPMLNAKDVLRHSTDDSRKILEEILTSGYQPDYAKYSVHTLLSRRKLIAYGGGDGFVAFSYFILKKYHYDVSLLLDIKFKAGDQYRGVPAASPADYQPTRAEQDDALVIVTIGDKKLHPIIFKTLHDMGFKNIILSIHIYEYHLLHTPAWLEAAGFSYYLDHREDIFASFDLLADELSQSVYAHFLKTHIVREPQTIPHRPLSEQYFPTDIHLDKGYQRTIHCGAYNGDTVRLLQHGQGKIDALACFEPDMENFQLLAAYLAGEHQAIANHMMVFPCGVFSKTSQLRFNSGNTISSTIDEKGDTIIQCVALDDALPGFAPTFINMDIEGSEPEALLGARQMIQKYHPDLALCVYHTPNHAWELPRLVKQLHPDYKLFLRNYTSFPAETVLYATE